jgi:hypothetical protein
MTGGQMTGADWIFAGGTPVVNDLAIVPGTAGFDAVDTAGLAEGIDLNLLMTHPLFSGRFGSQGTPIRGCADFVHILNSAGFYFEVDGLGATLTCDLIVVDCKGNAQAPVELGSNPGDLGKIDQVQIVRGDVLIKGNTVWATTAKVQVGSTTRRNNDAKLKIDSGIAALPDLKVSSGKVECLSIVTDLTMCAGELKQDTAKIVRADIQGGTLTYNHVSVGGDVLSIVVHAGGVLDLMGNSVEKTIDQVIAHPGSNVLWNPAIHAITDFKDHRNLAA